MEILKKNLFKKDSSTSKQKEDSSTSKQKEYSSTSKQKEYSLTSKRNKIIFIILSHKYFYH